MAGNRYETLLFVTEYYEKCCSDVDVETVFKVFAFLLSDSKSLLERATCLVDDQEIVAVRTSEQSRKFWLIKSSTSMKKYRLLERFCPCRYYFDQFRRCGSENAICKHLLAVLMARSLGKIKQRIVHEEEFIGLLSEKAGFF